MVDVALCYMPGHMKFQIINTLVILSAMMYVRIKLNKRFQQMEERFEARKKRRMNMLDFLMIVDVVLLVDL